MKFIITVLVFFSAVTLTQAQVQPFIKLGGALYWTGGDDFPTAMYPSPTAGPFGGAGIDIMISDNVVTSLSTKYTRMIRGGLNDNVNSNLFQVDGLLFVGRESVKFIIGPQLNINRLDGVTRMSAASAVGISVEGDFLRVSTMYTREFGNFLDNETNVGLRAFTFTVDLFVFKKSSGS